jgi:predicted dehydrogenase
MNKNKVRIALVGCGGIAQAHWRGIQSHAPSIQVTAVIDTNHEYAKKMATFTASESFSTLEEALEKGTFDAVDIMLPHDQHEAAAIQSFTAGKHVVLEKPMAPTLDACKRILSAAENANKVFMVAEQSQYWPEILIAQQIIQEGRLGQIITARAYFGGPAESKPTNKPWRYELSKAGGGIVMDGGAHWIRPLRMWLGEIKEVVAVTSRLLPDMEGESFARALLRFETGIVALFDAQHGGEFVGPGEEFRITGEKGELLIEKGTNGRLIYFDTTCPNGEILYQGKEAGRAASFGYELQDFAEAVLNGKKLEANAEYSLGELRTALAIYKSAETKNWQPVNFDDTIL